MNHILFPGALHSSPYWRIFPTLHNFLKWKKVLCVYSVHLILLISKLSLRSTLQQDWVIQFFFFFFVANTSEWLTDKTKTRGPIFYFKIIIPFPHSVSFQLFSLRMQHSWIDTDITMNFPLSFTAVLDCSYLTWKRPSRSSPSTIFPILLERLFKWTPIPGPQQMTFPHYSPSGAPHSKMDTGFWAAVICGM